MCRMPMIDLALTAMVAWTLWLFCNGRPLDRQAHLLGISFGLGMLAKWAYLFFILFPAVYSIYRNLKYGSVPVKRAWRSMGWMMFWIILLAAPWYFRAAPKLMAKVPAQLSGEVARIEGDPALSSIRAYTTYAFDLEKYYTRLPLTILLAIGLCAFAGRWVQKTRSLRNSDRDSHWILLMICLVSAYVIMSLIANKDPRYIMPLIPVIAVISTHWIESIRRSFHMPVLMLLLGAAVSIVYWNLFVHFPPNRRDMKIETVAEWITTHRGERKAISVLVIPNSWTDNASALNYALYRRNNRDQAQRSKVALSPDVLKEYQYILVTDPPDKDTAVAPHVSSDTALMRNESGWQVCAQFPRDNGSQLVLLEPPQ
jgi:4-amino-4-deoxy-L-arabinose transferase-like glycosyltransferase